MALSEGFKNKKNIAYLVGGIVAIVVIFVGISVFTHRQVSIASDVKASFSGYNGRGNADYNSEKIDKKITSLYAKRSGLSEYQVQQVLSDSAYVQSLPSNKQDKALDVVGWDKELSIGFDHYSGLKNGETVKFSVSNGDDKDNPVKEITKKYKVSGLKKVKTVSTQKYLDTVKTSFTGFNGKGVVQIDSSNKMFDGQNVKVKHNGKLSNGDKITLNLKDAFPDREGKAWSGKKSIEVTVSGLEDLSKIANIDEVKGLLDGMAKDDADQSTENSFNDASYTATFVSMYAQKDESNSLFDYYDDDASDYVTVNESSDEETSDEDNNSSKVKVIGLYKKESTDDSEDTEYEEATLEGITLKDNKLNVADVNTDSSGNISSDYSGDSVSSIQHNLAADGVKLR